MGLGVNAGWCSGYQKEEQKQPQVLRLRLSR